MKLNLSKTSRLIFIFGIAFLLFNSCEKENFISDFDDQTEIDIRGKCTKVEAGPIVKVPVPPQPPAPQEPAAQQLLNAVCAALQNAINNEKDADVKTALQSAKAAYTIEAAQGDSNFLGQEDVVGVAFPYHYMYYDDKGKLIIIVIAIQILEQPATQLIMDHEDGHSFISQEVAKKVAEKAAEDAKNMDPKPTPDEVKAKVAATIKEVEDEAQAAFDTATASGTKGDQAMEAKKAAKAAIKKYLHPPK